MTITFLIIFNLFLGLFNFVISISHITTFYHVTRDKMKNKPNPCPHGYEDWSDCPDYGH
jgi:hypothetical protein